MVILFMYIYFPAYITIDTPLHAASLVMRTRNTIQRTQTSHIFWLSPVATGEHIRNSRSLWTRNKDTII